jgi:transposase
MVRDIVTEIRRGARRQLRAEDKIRIVMGGLRGEISVFQLCRRESISPALYYQWAKAFLGQERTG